MKRFIQVWILVTASLLTMGVVASAEEFAYLGSDKCKKCHFKQYKSWAETKMAKSFELLQPGVAAEAKQAAGLQADQDYTQDAECLACHTTGYGKPGGFVDLATTPKLVGVGCETCHGPGGSYVADDKMSTKNKNYKKADLVALGMVSPPTEAECRVCHNDKSPFYRAFEFEARKDEGTHEHIALKYEH